MSEFIKRIEKMERRIGSLEIFFYFLITFLMIICNALIFKKHFILLVENQILYIFSVIAQVVGTFIGVSIAGYTLLDSRNNSIEDIDDDGIKELQKSVASEQFSWLIRIIIYGLIDIVLCLFSISLYDKKPSYLFDIVSDEALVILLLFFYILIKFTLFLSPKAISKQSDIIKHNMDKAYPKKTAKIITFDDFIIKYNRLENVLYDLANEFDKKDHMAGAVVSCHGRGILYSCRTLKEIGILKNATSKVLDDIRQYRNVLVHGTEENKNISEEIYDKLTRILELLESLRDYVNENQNANIYESKQYIELVNYSFDNVVSDAEKKN